MNYLAPDDCDETPVNIRFDRRMMERRRRPRYVPVLAAISVTAVIFSGVRVSQGLPAPRVTAAARTISVPGAAPTIPWPRLGQAAVAIPSVGFKASNRSERSAPIASLTKMMTAHLILQHHPLPAGEPGPSIPVSKQAVDDYETGRVTNQSGLPVTLGARLTQRQMLEALLIGSANNIAAALAVWDMGSTTAFVTAMNETAVSLGMTNTNYTDTSGYEDTTVSTALDQLTLAMKAMEDPTFREIVGKSEVTIPGAGVVRNYNRQVGKDGLIGVKTGSTRAAGGCFVAAVKRVIGGKEVMAFAAVMGQPGPDLVNAGLNAGATLGRAISAFPVETVVLEKGTVVGRQSVSWGSSVPVVVGADVKAVTMPGTKIELVAKVAPKGSSLGPRDVGTIAVKGDGGGSAPIRTVAKLSGPSMWWRITHT